MSQYLLNTPSAKQLIFNDRIVKFDASGTIYFSRTGVPDDFEVNDKLKEHSPVVLTIDCFKPDVMQRCYMEYIDKDWLFFANAGRTKVYALTGDPHDKKSRVFPAEWNVPGEKMEVEDD
jgi:hypothetical protein